MNELIAFWGLASLVTLCSVLVVTLRNPVSAAVSLVVALFFLSGIYALLGADFVAVIQVIVYTGAILVLFLFVIMLLNLDPATLEYKKRGKTELGICLFALLSFGYIGYSLLGSSHLLQTALAHDNTYEIAMLLFRKYVWPFELVSMLILLAIIASIVIAKKKALKEK